MSAGHDVSATLEIVEQVRSAALEADGQDPLDEAADLALKHQGLAGIDALVDEAGHGFALVRDGQIDLAVDPSHRGLSIGRNLLEQALGSASVSTAWSHGDHPAAARLASTHGFSAQRALWVMRRAPAPLPISEVPPEITVRAFRPTDLDGLLAVNAQAFSSHPEQGQMDRADFGRRTGEDWFDPAGLLVAVDTASQELLGFHWTKRHTPTTGEVYVVGVSPDAQGRGLGRILTLAGLQHLGQTTDVLLYVESDNEPAIGVYSKFGFEHAARDTHVQYRRS